ncbi:MAG: glycosyltransferase family 2 protein [Magnetococcales bacterium]|nr:glycosyltransferase family 2 protein [Magnetococcales bacterium]
MIQYSVVVPCYNEAASLEELCTRLAAVFSGMGAGDRFEVCLVDDGSTDATVSMVDGLIAQFPFVRLVRLRRNFGKAMALMTGFQFVQGETVITLDADLQDNPEEIPKMVAKLGEGYDIVNGWRERREDQWIRKIGSRLYNGTVARLGGLELKDMNCGFKAYRAEVVEKLCIYGQFHRYIPLQAHLLGFKVTEIQITNSPRRHGTSKYRTFRYEGGFDLLSMLFIHRYGLNPLHFFGVIGFSFIAPSLIILGYLFLRHMAALFTSDPSLLLFNRPMLSLSLTAIMVGFLILLTGLVCDFFLHHHIRERMDDIVRLAIQTKVNIDPPSGKNRIELEKCGTSGPSRLEIISAGSAIGVGETDSTRTGGDTSLTGAGGQHRRGE